MRRGPARRPGRAPPPPPGSRQPRHPGPLASSSSPSVTCAAPNAGASEPTRRSWFSAPRGSPMRHRAAPSRCRRSAFAGSRASARSKQVGRRRPLAGVEGETPAGAVGRRALEEVVERSHQRVGGLCLDRSRDGQVALGSFRLPEAAPGEPERVVDGGGAGVKLERALQGLDGRAELSGRQRHAPGAVPRRGRGGVDGHGAREERLCVVRPPQREVGVAEPDQRRDVVRGELAGVLEARRRLGERAQVAVQVPEVVGPAPVARIEGEGVPVSTARPSGGRARP